MIKDGRGDILAAEVDALVNTVNCVGVMGKGLALQFKRNFPDNYEQYQKACKNGQVQLGRMFVVELSSVVGPRYIINFPTKNHWRSRSKIEDISSGLDDLIQVVHERNIGSVAVPPLGVGNGGLPWREIEALIRQKFDSLSDIDVILFTPSNASRNLAPESIKMTWGRATVVQLIREYVRRRSTVEPWESTAGASHLEIQKLMYFAEYFAPTLRLHFDRGLYGPYSERVRHLVQQMESAYLQGFGDGTAPVQQLDPIEPTSEGIAESERYISSVDEDKDVIKHIVRPVMNVIDGFEGPYSIELLASTLWVADHEKCQNADEAWQAIQKWTYRKSRLFTKTHVSTAWAKVLDSGLLATE